MFLVVFLLGRRGWRRSRTRRRRGSPRRGRNQNLVNHVDHAVGSLDVAFDHVGIVDRYLSVPDFDVEIGPILVAVEGVASMGFVLEAPFSRICHHRCREARNRR